MTLPQLAIIHIKSIPDETFTEFIEDISAENLDFEIESRAENTLYAGMEWLIPTAVIFYISKSYFDGFLKEMGKDHYAQLKSGLSKLRSKFLEPETKNVTIISSKGKSSDQKYSLLYSILAEGNGFTFKLMFQREVTEAEYEEIISSFLNFLETYHNSGIEPEKLKQLEKVRVVGKTILLKFNHESKSIEPVDPLPIKQEAN